ncbi:hypothetical protein [Novosphingopyxis iocasae]|nr:hypothetical protein [Novosphingopyxis iocasae]
MHEAEVELEALLLYVGIDHDPDSDRIAIELAVRDLDDLSHHEKGRR